MHDDNPNMSEVFEHMRVARRPKRKSRPRKKPEVKKERGFFDQLRMTRAQRDEVRIDALRLRFQEEMIEIGRLDLLDDDTDFVFDKWLNENGLVEEDRAARFTGRTVKRACADPIKDKYSKFRYEHTGTAKRARQLGYIEAARLKELERREVEYQGDPDAQKE